MTEVNILTDKLFNLCKQLKSDGFSHLNVLHDDCHHAYKYFKNSPNHLFDSDLFSLLYFNHGELELEERGYWLDSNGDGRWYAERVQHPIRVMLSPKPVPIEKLLESEEFDPLSILTNVNDPNHKNLKEYLKRPKFPENTIC